MEKCKQNLKKYGNMLYFVGLIRKTSEIKLKNHKINKNTADIPVIEYRDN